MTEWTDEKLVSIFRETSDSTSFEQLVQRHASDVRATVLGMVRSDADADDITQEIFVRAARGLAHFRADSTFKTWLFQITMNTTRSFLSAKARRGELFSDRNAAPTDPPGSSAECPEQRAIARELEEHLEAALASLPVNLRAALVLTVLEGHDVAEVARIEGCTRATIYWRVHKARRLIRDALPEGVDP